MKLSKIIIALSLAAGISLSCNRDNTSTTEVDQTAIQTEASANTISDGNADLAMDFATTFEGTFALKGGGQNPNFPCANVTITSNNGAFPKVITVDFGTGCTDKNGITRKGKIIFTISEKLFVPGATIDITHQDFYVNDRKIEGEIKLKNITTNIAVPTFSKEVTNGKITNEDGSYFTFTSQRKWRMVEGVATPFVHSDDAFEFYEGSQNITRSNGTYFTSTIKTPLLKRNACPFVSKGSVYLKGSKIDGTLDFGNGDCDNQATFTDANGNVITITLK